MNFCPSSLFAEAWSLTNEERSKVREAFMQLDEVSSVRWGWELAMDIEIGEEWNLEWIKVKWI